MIIRQHVRQLLGPRTVRRRGLSRSHSTQHLIRIEKATFYNSYPSSTDTSSNPPLFRGLDFTLPAYVRSTPGKTHWAVLSNASIARTTFLRILSGSLICLPPTARSYPFLSDHASHPAKAISYIGFDAERTGPSATRGAYLSARYESRKEADDFTLQDYLTGNTELNPLEDRTKVDHARLQQSIEHLRLSKLLSMPVSSLSNGQTRRARIAKALVSGPELLLLDGPFMGLDPPSISLLSNVLHSLAESCAPRLVLSLRQNDPIPDWITHLVLLEDTNRVTAQGPKATVLASQYTSPTSTSQAANTSIQSTDGFLPTSALPPQGKILVEIRSTRIAYSPTSPPVLGGWPGGLNLTVRANQRLALLGPNGSGKTTLLSLITSDHPQAYAQDVRIFGRPRLPDPTKGERGISIFELQRRIGHASPEVHAFFPRGISMRRALESTWADAPLAKPEVGDGEKKKVERVLAWFWEELCPLRPDNGETPMAQGDGEVRRRESSLDWARETKFGELSFSSQRLVLFLRAILGGQEIIVLDEVFSGMDRAVRDKAFLFLAHGDRKRHVSWDGASDIDGQDRKLHVVHSELDSVIPGLSEHQALIVIAHDKGDVPGCVREWMCLPEPAGPGEEQKLPRTGVLPGPLELHPHAWEEIWGSKES